ncbi:MAG: hypothetical protein AB8H80_18785 [Planctomycetota bacterium]
MEKPGTGPQHSARRAAAAALHAALAARCQHPEQEPFWRTAHRRALQALATACRVEPLVLQLHSGSVQVSGMPVFPFAADEPPFGLLRGAGIGEIAIPAGCSSESLDELVAGLFELGRQPDRSSSEDGLQRLLGRCRPTGIELRAVRDLHLDTEQPLLASDWSLLPDPTPTSDALRAAVERDAAANLRAMVARVLLEDLDAAASAEHSDPDGDASLAECLRGLTMRLLDGRDAATLTWLLGEVDSRAAQASAATAVPSAAHELRTVAHNLVHARVDAAWLKQQLEGATPDEAMQLSSLALQLGSDTAAQFADAARDIAHPLSQWLGELLGAPPPPPPSESAR